MAINPNDPNLKIYHAMEESSAGGIRRNAGAVGSLLDLTPWRSDGTHLLSVQSNGKGGKEVNFDPLDITSSTKSIRAENYGNVGDTPANFPYYPAWATLFAEGSGLGMTWAMRFTVVTIRAGATFAPAMGWCISGDAGGQAVTGLCISTEPGGTAGLGYIRVWAPKKTTTNSGLIFDGATGCTLDGDSPDTPSPADSYLEDGKTYTVFARIVEVGSSSVETYVTCYNETDDEEYRWTWVESDLRWEDYHSLYSTYLSYAVGGPHDIVTSNIGSAPAWIDWSFIYEGILTDDEIQSVYIDGISVPWTEPNYRVADHDVRVAMAHENSTLPATRPLPVGGMNPRHTANIKAKRLRLRYEGFRPGRPWSRRRTDIDFDSIGPFSSKRHNMFVMGPTNALIRQPGILPPEAAADVRNVEFSGPGVRRRRGFKVRRDISSLSDTGQNAMFSFRNTDDELFWLYKAGDRLYYEGGATAIQLDTGWGTAQSVVGAYLDNRLILCNTEKRSTWRGTSALESFGEDAPSTGSAAPTVGTLIGVYTYAYTFYDPTTGDETAPYVFTPVTLATEGALLSSLDNAPTDSRFSQQKIYRSAAGVAAPDLYLFDTQNNATTYTDDGSGAQGTTEIGNVNGDYFTATAPQDFIGCVTHAQRMFYWYNNQLWWSEADEPLRWLSTSFITSEYPITAVISQGYRVVIYTRKTVEIVESDFIRDDNGNYSIRRTVLTRHVGTPGPHSVIDWDDDIYWMDVRGIYKLVGDRIQKQSGDIDNLFLLLNSTAAKSVCGAVNHFRNQLWWVAPFADIQDDNSRFNTVIVLHPGEEPRFSIHELELSFVTQWDDDLNGVRFGGVDHLGVFKELESYEGDGAEGDESFTTEDEGDDLAVPLTGISSISGSVVTVHGTPGWTADALRGMGVVLRDRSSGVLYYYTIQANAAGTFTTNTIPNAALADGDGYFIGGIRAYEEPAEQDMKSANDKHINQIQTQFDDLTSGRFA